MVGASGPVRGPHPIRASGKLVKDDSSPVRGPHAGQRTGTGNTGRDGGKESDGAAVVVADVMRDRVIPVAPPLDVLPNLSLNVSLCISDKLTLRATRAE